MLLHLRQDYHSESLDFTNMDTDPAIQFHNWFQDALKASIKEPNAMTLSTATLDGRPSARTVLLKDYSVDGFSFFTNYTSKKGGLIDENPYVALTFLWLELHRQVRIEGIAEQLPAAANEAYFQSRPRGSQIGAWASPQSKVLDSRAWLESQVEALEKQYEGQEKLPLPPFWGGYLVKPTLLEFWQGQPSRLHDRFQYTPAGGAGAWDIKRLAP